MKATLEADVRNTGAMNDEYYSKVNALQIELDDVRTSHADWTETEKAYKDQVKRMRTDIATLELQNRKLHEKLELAGDSEGGNQEIVKDLEDQLKMASEKIGQLEKKTRTAMQRVYELQGQLMDMEEQERERTKIARTQAPTP
jgi:chromosome segregation ATPase